MHLREETEETSNQIVLENFQIFLQTHPIQHPDLVLLFLTQNILNRLGLVFYDQNLQMFLLLIL